MESRVFLLTSLIFFSLYAKAQPVSYPKNYFRNPLNVPIQLSANFGELRPNHWHMGLDIRTDQKENLPVYAAAGGFITHIGVRSQSFGRFIIIEHPNGVSTLYAHLNDFYPELEQYVTEQQYKQESWTIELDLADDKFPVNKGQFIAFSGNTGGSQGPHLHFEIFDTKTTKRFNPLLFGLPVPDNVTPTLVKLAMYDRSRSVFEQTPVFFNLKNTDSGYIIPKMPVIKTGLKNVSFALQAYDRQSGSSNPNGIYSAKLYVDDEPQVGFILDSIDYDETVYINAQIDYKYHANGGAFLQHLSQLPGDHGAAYRRFNSDGVIHLADTNVHMISIDVKDAQGNTAQLNFNILYVDSLGSLLPERPVSTHIMPNSGYEFRKPDFEVDIPTLGLYDSLQLLYYRSNPTATYIVSGVHQLNDATIPLHEEMKVRIKPNRQIPDAWMDKLLIQRSGRGNTLRKAIPDGEWFTARFGDFGSFQVVADVVPPQLNELGKGDTINLSAASRILFTPTDNFGMVKKFRAELNGQWLRFTNDKSRNWIYIFDDRCPYGVHELKVTVEDHAGNITSKTWWFKREPYTPPLPKKKSSKKKSGTTKKKTVKKKK